jgi:hypothetical protein
VSRHARKAAALAALALVLAVAGLVELGSNAAPRRRPAASAQVVVVRDLEAGARLTPDARGFVRVPARYAARGAVISASAAVGRRLAVALPAGAVLMQPELQAGEQLAAARDVAIRLDGAAGLPAGDLVGARADVLLVPPGRAAAPAVVLADVLVVAAHTSAGVAVATLRLPAPAVGAVVAAEGRGSLRLVVRAPAGAP